MSDVATLTPLFIGAGIHSIESFIEPAAMKHAITTLVQMTDSLGLERVANYTVHSPTYVWYGSPLKGILRRNFDSELVAIIFLLTNANGEQLDTPFSDVSICTCEYRRQV